MFSQSNKSSTASSHRTSSSSSKQSKDRISLNHSSSNDDSTSISTPEENQSSTSNQTFAENSNNSGKSSGSNDLTENRSNDFTLHTTLDSSSSDNSTVPPTKKVATLKRSSELLPCPPGTTSHPAVVIDGFLLHWPKFEIRNAVFENQSYSISNTCNIDCGLFILYYLYRTDLTIEKFLFDAPDGSPYATLRRTFQYVDTDGWDIARIFWSLTNQLLKTSDRKIKNLFGSEALCARVNCSERRRILINTELCIAAHDEVVSEFADETVAVCTALFKRLDELDPADDIEGMVVGRVAVFDVQSNKPEYVDCMTCNAQTRTTAAKFEQNDPPIVLVDVVSVMTPGNNGRYQANDVRLSEIKRVLKIGDAKYGLRAVINYRSSHFTATLIGKSNQLYIFDDMSGVERVQRSMDPIETGIYTLMH